MTNPIKEARAILERLKREGLGCGEKLTEELREAVEEQIESMTNKKVRPLTVRLCHKGGPWNRKKSNKELRNKAIYELRKAHYWTYTDLGQLFGIADETAKRIAEEWGS